MYVYTTASTKNTPPPPHPSLFPLTRLGKTASHASLLCQCVYDGDLDLLKCLLLAGCEVNAGDYDARTALHISAAEGNLPAVRLLLDVGHADVGVRDRWNNTPLMEAQRVNAVSVVKLLQEASTRAAGKKVVPVQSSPAGSERDADQSTASSSDVQQH